MLLYVWACSWIASCICSIILPRIALYVIYPSEDTILTMNSDVNWIFPLVWTMPIEWIVLSSIFMFISNLLFLRHKHLKYIFIYTPLLVFSWIIIVFLFGVSLWTLHDFKKTFAFSWYISQLLMWIMIWYQKYSIDLFSWISFILYLDEYDASHPDSYYYARRLTWIVIIFGLWCGSIVVPLDWGKVWQHWPIPHFIATQISLLASPIVLFIHHLLKSS